MAKSRIDKENLNEQNDETLDEKSPGIFQKIFYLVIIPLLFVIAILLVVAHFTNVNVFEKASDILPFTKQEESSPPENSNEKIVELQAEIQEKEAEIVQLQTELDTAKTENENNLAKQEDLQKQIEELQRSQDESKKEFNEILSTFKKMSAKTAAPILTQMSDEEALKILSNMDAETLSAIFSKMDPQDAARYTELLSAENE